MFALEVKQILGTPSDFAWSQVHHFSPQEKDKQEKRGELVFLVSLKLSSEADSKASVVGREIISRIYEEYFGSFENKPMDQLKQAFLKVGQEKLQFFKSPENLSLIALVFWKEVIYIAIWSSGSVLLRRNKKTATLVQGKKSEVCLASGFFKQNDLFFISTSDFMEKIPEAMIKASLSTEDPEVIVDVLAPVVCAKEKQGNIAGAVIKLVALKEKRVLRLPKKNLLDLTKLQKALGDKNNFLNKILKLFKKIPLNLFKSKKQSSFFLTIGFLVLLGISLFFGWRKKAETRKELEISSKSQAIEEKLETVSVLRSLDPENSLKIVEEIKLDLAILEKISPEKANAFQVRIQSLTSNLGSEEVSPDLFYDLKLIDENLQINQVACDKGEVVIFDKINSKIVFVNLENKSGEILAAGNEFKDQNLLAFSQERIFFVSDNEISLLQKDSELEKLADLDLDNVPIDSSGWLGNFYLVTKNQIWKYPAVESGVGSKRAWLSSEIDLDQAVSIDIDGSIWILLSSGRFYNLLSGLEQEITLNLPSGMGRVGFLTVSREGNVIAFWDKDNDTIWVFDKIGQFISRIPIETEKIEVLTGLELSLSGEVIYIFGKNKIFNLQLE